MCQLLKVGWHRLRGPTGDGTHPANQQGVNRERRDDRADVDAGDKQAVDGSQ